MATAWYGYAVAAGGAFAAGWYLAHSVADGSGPASGTTAGSLLRGKLHAKTSFFPPEKRHTVSNGTATAAAALGGGRGGGEHGHHQRKGTDDKGAAAAEEAEEPPARRVRTAVIDNDIATDEIGPELVYFNIRGRAEAARLFLEDRGVLYKDTRVSGDQWRQMLKGTVEVIFQQLPLLKHSDGTRIVQSNAILRHLARLYDAYGSSFKERAHIDELLDGAEDLRLRYLRMVYVDGAQNIDEYLREKRTTDMLLHFENILKARAKSNHATSNSGSNKRKKEPLYIASSQFSIADASLWEVLDTHLRLPTHAGRHLLDAYPQLQAFHARVEARPRIRAYLDSGRRPDIINGNGKGQ